VRSQKSDLISYCSSAAYAADIDSVLKAKHPEIPNWPFDDEFDGGEETCGRVIVNLHLYIRDQEPGVRILVISRDPGAPVELPAWCRMTKNELTEMQHPYYLITLKPHLVRK
jgi:TusA-related sulfurtransferase